MRGAFDRRRLTIVDMLNAIPGSPARSPKVRSTPTRASAGCWAAASAESGPDVCRTRGDHPGRSRGCRLCPVRLSAPEGYLRLSYALGDDDLVEGVERIAALLSE